MIKRACWEARHSPEGRDIPKFAFGHLFSFKFPTKVHHKSWTCYGFRKLSFPSHLFQIFGIFKPMSRTMFLYIILIVSYHFLSIPSLITEVLQTKKSVSPNKSLWGLNLWCKDLVPQKRMKRICSECVDCFGHWAVFMCWTESGLCTRDGWQRADHPQRCQFHPTNLFLSLNLWCKDLVPLKKKEKDM